MKIISTKFSGLKIILSKNHRDSRGLFKEDFKKKFFKNKKFIFGCTSSSKKNVLRGMHLQLKKSQAKFITVLKGKIFDVCLDCRKKSKTFGKYFSIILSDKENKSLLIPAGFAHGSVLCQMMLYYITNVQIIEIKNRKLVFYGMIKISK